uniref:Ig-like domain-containing protein n=1 Tax=Labrus bergylta TaxID=56723 RepID=A0A3Q3EKZ4_9LABR
VLSFACCVLLVAAVSPDCVCGSELKVTVRPGDNITLYCDCKRSTGVYIMWYRNCSHENQPSLVLKRNTGSWTESLPPNFHLLKNQSSDSYDLLILNITESDEGLYYCGTEEPKIFTTATATSQQESYSVSTLYLCVTVISARSQKTNKQTVNSTPLSDFLTPF